jgi:radical SAM superfamily enzyme YgiQ (UPF0313 family)
MNIKSALLIYPPTGIYDRFERCQSPVESESVTILRPPLDLMYLAAILERNAIKVHLRDYPAEGKNWGSFKRDIEKIAPDLLLVSATVHTVSRDCLAFEIAKKSNPSVICVLKGFFPDQGRQVFSDFPSTDVVLREDAEFALEEFIRGKPLRDIPGLSCRFKEKIEVNPNRHPLTDLDYLPFPARHLADNNLYRMPDNGKKMGMVLVSKGCPHDCIFCLVPLVNHQKVRLRSPDSLAAELQECVHKHGITDFWFRADNFTVNRDWVLRVCDKINGSRLAIRWATNSRVDSLDAEMISAMKKSGCFAIGLGIESGSQETLQKIKKKISKQQAKETVSLCRRHGLQTYLFFIIGFPWETARHIQETINFAQQLKGDIINFSFATPFPGTALFDLCVKLGVLKTGPEYASGNYGTPLTSTLYLNRKQLLGMEKSAYRQIIFSPAYILRNLSRIRSPKECLCHFKAALHLIRLCV